MFGLKVDIVLVELVVFGGEDDLFVFLWVNNVMFCMVIFSFVVMFEDENYGVLLRKIREVVLVLSVLLVLVDESGFWECFVG